MQSARVVARVMVASGLMAALLATGSACAQAPVPVAAGEDAKLAAFFLDYLGAAFRVRPLWATRLGDHRFDDRLDDLSPAGRDAVVALDRQTLACLPQVIDASRLSRDGRIDLDILRRHLERSIRLAECFRPHEDDPTSYVEAMTWSVYSVADPSPEGRRRALARMLRVPGVVAAARASLKNPPRIKTDAAIAQLASALVFYRDGVFGMTAVPRGSGELGRAAAEVVEALEGYKRFLEEDLRTRSTGDWRLGRDLYLKKFEAVLDPGLSADELLAEAEAEADRVEREMGVIARQMWGTTFPDEPLPPDDGEGRREMIRRVLGAIARDHGTRESLAVDVQSTVAELRSFIARNRLLLLPTPDRCLVTVAGGPVASDAVAYFVPTPPFSPGSIPTFVVNPPPAHWPPDLVESYLQEYPRPMLKVLAMHEGYPGHYVQLAHADGQPSTIRRVLSSDVFAEGWAVYAEGMMLDQGFGAGDLALRLCQLKFYLRSVVNAILDRKRHVEGLTDPEAMALLTGRAFQTEGEATRKLGRTMLTSCQLASYFAGRTALHRLRQKVQKAQGPRFNLGRFHEAVLAHGTIPVRYLDELVVDP